MGFSLGPFQPFPLISASRWLLKRGELYLLLSEEGGLFRRGAGRLCYLFLFNDVLIITKKKRLGCTEPSSFSGKGPGGLKSPFPKQHVA